MVEQLIRNEQVGGSIPFTSSNEQTGILDGCLFVYSDSKQGIGLSRADSLGFVILEVNRIFYGSCFCNE